VVVTAPSAASALEPQQQPRLQAVVELQRGTANPMIPEGF
jgi:hypothetical protein